MFCGPETKQYKELKESVLRKNHLASNTRTSKELIPKKKL